MAYKIGQVRKANISSFIQELPILETTVKTEGYGNKIFNDYAITINGGNFAPAAANGASGYSGSYYLRFRIKRIRTDDPRFSHVQGPTGGADDPRQLVFTLKLMNKPVAGDTMEQIIDKSIVVDPYIVDSNNDTQYFYYDTIFTPNNTYKYLAFVLSRGDYDYMRGVRNDIVNNIQVQGVNGDVALVEAIPIPTSDKIGIQTRPGSLVCVNREAIRVGRSGVYEVNSGLKVFFVGMAAPNGQVDNFILDYAYDDSEG